MLYSSRITISHILPCAEYSANNAFNYNGNNGNLNNNNKNNTNNSRALLELDGLQASLESHPFPISEFYSVYRQTRKHKANKPSHLLFQLDYPRHLREICREVNGMDYHPTTSIAFIITKPRVREVIAADFRDRVVQTLLVREILPHLEEVEHPHSYSCRVGKGCLAAVQRLQELNDKYKDGYVCFLDLANHFMSIDTELWTPRVQGFNALGFRIKRNNITPSKRLVHNFKRLVGFLLLVVEDDVRNLYRYRDKAMERLNSTLSILSWSHSYNIRQEQIARLQESRWAQIFIFHDGFKKVTIRPSKTRRAYFFRRNRLRKQQSLKYYTL